jgi:hypothetical protein
VTDAVSLLLDNLEEIKDAFRNAGGDINLTFGSLNKTPVGILPWDSFQYQVPILLAAWEAGYQTGKKVNTKEDFIGGFDDVPRRLAGWSINQHARGYLRAFRKVEGRSRCVYLGTKFNQEEAIKKLKAKNVELGVNHVKTT